MSTHFERVDRPCTQGAVLRHELATVVPLSSGVAMLDACHNHHALNTNRIG
ncbi:MAG: hypothetical protein ABI679_03555 [Gemmatimonadota bacterium]